MINVWQLALLVYVFNPFIANDILWYMDFYCVQ